MQLVKVEKLTDDFLSDIVARDCVLWVTEDCITSKAEVDAYLALANAPWRAVYIESTCSEFAGALAGQSQSANATDSAGAFSHIIASDPLTLVLQRRAKPIFFLNGRADCTSVEGVGLPSRSEQRRRLNMTARLPDIAPRRVVIIGLSPKRAIEDLIDLWEIEFRSLITIVTDQASEVDTAAEWLGDLANLNVIQWISQSPLSFAETLTTKLGQLDLATRRAVRVQLPGQRILEVDLAPAEMAEQPIADLCDFICVNDTLPVAPNDLRKEEFQHFFTRDGASWRSHAAGLPWVADRAPERILLKGLRGQLSDPPGNVPIYSIVSEAGAGGTTHARHLAFAAARAGFPVLLAKQQGSAPSGLELTGFFFRAVGEIARCASAEGFDDSGEPVWLLVLDVQHGGRRFEDIERLWGDLSRSGRKVVLLKVVSADAPLAPPESVTHVELLQVRHSLELEEVADLGRHLNVFLRSFGEQKSTREWTRFWECHRPEMDTGIASFWIALEFWLAGFLALGESIQSWTLKQFKGLDDQTDVQRAIMEIAAFAVERKAMPERLLAPLNSPKLPWSYVLETARRGSPGLGIVRGETFPLGRVWAVAHDVLARYLLNAVWNDRVLCEELDLPFAEDPVALRLSLIERVANRPCMGETFATPFAVDLATRVLKLDEEYGNAEFFRFWRKVISVLESVPKAVRLSSRAFNHHVAISRRRVTQGDLFEIDDSEKKQLLLKAAREVEFALEQISGGPDDESDLNLLNTLALIYQDLAELARRAGIVEELVHWLAKSDEFTNRALKENPNSPYVLETAAKNLLRRGLASNDDGERLESAAKALSFVFQASRMDSAYTRRRKLGRLAAQALRTLRDQRADSIIDRLCMRGSSYGYVAKAWCLLPFTDDDESSLLLDEIDPELAGRAIAILNTSPTRDWLLVGLLYDLLVIANPRDFQGQLRLLDELGTTRGYNLSLQQVLERAVLLYFAGLHKPATEEFRSLRPRVKEAQVVIFVPPRLRWLLTPDHASRAVCTAQVVDSVGSARGMAKVTELGGTLAPFNAQEFDKLRMGRTERFKCNVTFAAMGPFLKPIEGTHR